MHTSKQQIPHENIPQNPASGKDAWQNPLHRPELATHERFENYSDDLWAKDEHDVNPEIVQHIWKDIEHNIAKASQEKQHRRLLTIYRIAAAVLLPLTVALSAWFISDMCNDRHRANEVCEVVVDRGQKASLTLPDGTKVWMNSSSRLKYNNNYNQEKRDIELEGEAYFEVAPNPDKAFTVHCGDLNIEALGTAFNVKGYQDDDDVTVSLLEGKVRIYNDDYGTCLTPNQSLCYDRPGMRFTKTDIRDSREVDFWRRNILYFRSATLAEMAKTLERMYGVTIRFEDEELKQVTFSGSIRNNSLTNVFHIISLTYPLSYQMEKDTIIVRKKRGV